jgi:hypothetical protein
MAADVYYDHPELIYSVNLKWNWEYEDFCNRNGEHDNRLQPVIVCGQNLISGNAGKSGGNTRQ